MHGCPSMDLIEDTIEFDDLIKSSQSFQNIEKRKYFLVLLHPVTDFPNESIQILNNLIRALKNFKDNKIIIVSPNVDAGSEKIREMYKTIKNNLKDISAFIENLSPIHFLTLIKIFSNMYW